MNEGKLINNEFDQSGIMWNLLFASGVHCIFPWVSLEKPDSSHSKDGIERLKLTPIPSYFFSIPNLMNISMHVYLYLHVCMHHIHVGICTETRMHVFIFGR